jgi:peptidoglycan hydrolase CwlO-like protein
LSLWFSNTAITRLQQSLKAKDAEVDKPKESLSNKKTEVSKFGSQVQDIQKESTSLKENLQAQTARLGELEGLESICIWEVRKYDKLDF